MTDKTAEIRRDNLRRLITVKAAGNQTHFAAMASTSASTLNQILNGSRNMGERLARKIELNVGLDAGYMDIVELNADHLDKMERNDVDMVGEKIAGYEINRVACENGSGKGVMDIAILDYEDVAGDGWIEPEYVETKDKMPWQVYWLNERGLKNENLRVMKVRGDSMNDLLHDGDSILVDITDRYKPLNGHVYVVWVNGYVKVKRIEMLYDGSMKLKSDNKEYDSEIIPPEGLQYVHLIGRVHNKSGSGGL